MLLQYIYMCTKFFEKVTLERVSAEELNCFHSRMLNLN